MTAAWERQRLRQHTTLHIDGEVGTRVQPLPGWDVVVIHLGWSSDAALHLDRDGIALLETLLARARADLDAAQDEMAAVIEADYQATQTAQPSTGDVPVERISA